MNDSPHTPALSGRELSRARRREMSRTGGANIKAGRSNSRASATTPARATAPVATSAGQSSVAQQSVQTAAVEAAATEVGAKPPLTGKALSMARRARLAKGGKSALAANAKMAAPARSTAVVSQVVESKPGGTETSPAAKHDACCDECAEAGYIEPCEPCTTASEQAVKDTAVDSLCEIIETSPEAAANASSSVRAFCRERRNTLSRKGKLGLPGKAGRQAKKSLMRGAAASSLTGKAYAKLRREERCVVGRGDILACRPSGRVRSETGNAPPKVEVGTTLSGQAVTGTQVEQSGKITGIESGACRNVTGTEYLGYEQFEKFCSSAPQAAAAKVNLSETSHGQLVTGSKTAGSNKVTGDEAGDCKTVTGNEYLGAEHFGAFCSSQGMHQAKDKVVAGNTGKNMRITGVDEARDNAMTGSESGADQTITGSAYVNAIPRRQASAAAPAKVGMSHTAAGSYVSGGELSRISGITGDDEDICRLVTGTEYISTERFQTVCGSAPQRSVAKVGIDSSRGGMGITGNLFDRSKHVTGNEPGSCQRVTGSQYGEPARAGLCDQRSNKVHEMHTLQGRMLTGTETSPSPKLTGDDRGSCSDVTGSAYVSQEYFNQSCQQTPQPSAKMTGFSRTWHNQVVSGVQTGHSQKTTGDEHGICTTVTGSNYAGREQASEFCDASTVQQGEQRLRQHDDVAALSVSGMTPEIDERIAGNFQRGTCQQVTGTPYQGQQDRALCNSGNRHHLAQGTMAQSAPQSAAPANEAEPYQADFSVLSPAKAVWQQRDNDPVHSSVYGRRSSITGAVNKAEGVISGTPEFRHQRDMQPGEMQPAVAVLAAAQSERITGEGSESGTDITGDDWSRGGLITGTEGLFSANRNQTQQGTSVKRNNIGAHALKDRERPEAAISKVTGSSGNATNTGLVTLSGGASA